MTDDEVKVFSHKVDFYLFKLEYTNEFVAKSKISFKSVDIFRLVFWLVLIWTVAPKVFFSNEIHLGVWKQNEQIGQCSAIL